jgi:hypothetical protein
MFAAQTSEFSSAHRGEYLVIVGTYAILAVSNVV